MMPNTESSAAREQAMTNSTVRVEVLGAPRVLIDGAPAPLSRKRVRAILFYLAAERKPAPRTTLAWLFWPDKDPHTASRNLSIHLSYLKSALNNDIVVASQGTVALADFVETDVNDYFALANGTNRNDAKNALGLFRGPFLDGFSLKDADPFDQWAASEAEQWRNRRIDAAIERSFELESRGALTEALNVVDSAIATNPIREDLYRRTMRIMEKAGMRAQVGELYKTLTARLNDELGLPPSLQTVECYQSIIGSNDAFTATVKQTGQHALKDVDMPFIGRKPQMEAALATPSGSLALVSGASGMGKTRFLREMPRQADERRIAISFTQQTREMPFGALIDAVKTLTAQPDWPRLALRAQRAMGAEAWARLRCLVPSVDAESTQPTGAFALSSLQIQETLEDFLATLAIENPLHVTYDDIHYADAASLKTLTHIIGASAFTSVRFTATINPSISAPHAMALLNELQRSGRLTSIALSGIDDARMMDALLFYFPDIDEETATKLIRLADGSPHLMKTIIQGLDSGYTEFSGKASLQSLFEFTFKSLSANAADAATALAVHNAPCERELFEKLCGRDAQAALEELSSAGLASVDASGRVAILNKRMQEFLVSRLARDSRRLESAHLRIAQAMNELYGYAPANMQDIAICHHYSKSTHPRECGPYAAKAGDYLLQIDDVDAAIKYYKLAVKYLTGPAKLDASLILYINMSHMGKVYEADLYVQSALSIAQSIGRSDYEFAFTAARALNAIPEYEEVVAGVIPCYEKAIDPTIRTMLQQAERAAIDNNASPLLRGYIQGFLSSWYMIAGDFEKSIECLNRIVGISLCETPEENTSSSASIFFSALVTLISLMKDAPDPRIYDLIQLEEESFKETPIRSFSSSSEGIKSMLAYITGNREEGDRIAEEALVLLEAGHNEPMHAAMLATKGMLQHRTDPREAYWANFEAYRIAKKIGANYSLIRSLIGLVVTSPTKHEATAYLTELRELAGSVGDAKLYNRIANIAVTVKNKPE